MTFDIPVIMPPINNDPSEFKPEEPINPEIPDRPEAQPEIKVIVIFTLSTVVLISLSGLMIFS